MVISLRDLFDLLSAYPCFTVQFFISFSPYLEKKKKRQCDTFSESDNMV